MSDEEKKAIHDLKILKQGLSFLNCIPGVEKDEIDIKAINTILNLIEKQSKENESWKKYCDEQENDITLKNNKICDLEFKIEKQQKEIAQKNNIIDAMAEQLTTPVHNKRWIIDYFEEKVK